MTSLTKTRLRLGRIAYLNCLPFYEGLDDDDSFDLNYTESYPQAINEAMYRGTIDIAPISSLEYLQHQDEYMILPGFSISSREYSRSVLLLSNTKIEDLKGKQIALTHESASSAVLLKIILHAKHGIKNGFILSELAPNDALRQHAAALVIGDKALFYESDELTYKYDLGELWWKWQKQPFCFALWVVRRNFASENADAVKSFCEMLRKNRNKNLQNIKSLIKDTLKMDFLDKRFTKVYGYLSSLVYDLDDSVMEGLTQFYRCANELKVAPKAKPLQFFDAK